MNNDIVTKAVLDNLEQLLVFCSEEEAIYLKLALQVAIKCVNSHNTLLANVKSLQDENKKLLQTIMSSNIFH